MIISLALVYIGQFRIFLGLFVIERKNVLAKTTLQHSAIIEKSISTVIKISLAFML